MSKKLEMSIKIQNRATGVTAICQHLFDTIDYMCDS